MYKYFKGNLIAIVVILLFAVVLGAILWPYTLNTWLMYFDKPATVTWWQGAILGFVPLIGQATIPAAVITWLLMLFL